MIIGIALILFLTVLGLLLYLTISRSREVKAANQRAYESALVAGYAVQALRELLRNVIVDSEQHVAISATLNDIEDALNANRKKELVK